MRVAFLISRRWTCGETMSYWQSPANKTQTLQLPLIAKTINDNAELKQEFVDFF